MMPIPMDAVSDEEYLVLRARSCQQSDPFAAKAWLITAKTLFPTNFGIQFEVYSNEKTSKSTKEAAKYLEDLFRSFQSEPGLWKEVHAITEALQSESLDTTSAFLRDVFTMLPTDIQYQMLLSTADRSKDTQEHCKLLLLLLKKFPDKVVLHGMKLVETLSTAEKHSHYNSPVNCFRKLLVYDILPLIFKSSGVDFHPKQLYRLLNKCIEFYVSYITQPVSNSGPTAPPIIPGLQESEAVIISPWEQLADIFHSVGQKLKWELKDVFVTSSKEHQWQRIQTFCQALMSGSEDFTAYYKQVFFCTSILFLQSLYEYTNKIDPEQFTVNTGSNPLPSLVLIEGFRTATNDPCEQPKSKRRRLENEKEDNMPSIHVSKIAQTSSTAIIQNFLTASRCWELLHSTEFLEKDFKRLCQQLRMDSWPWYINFQLDSLTYQGVYQEAIARLQKLEGYSSPVFQHKILLRMASCFLGLGMNSAACERILSIVVSLPKRPSAVPYTSQHNMFLQTSSTGRQLYFINYDRQEVLHYCVKLILMCFKERALRPGVQDDLALGHLIVLLQYDWPHTEPIFNQAIDKIREQGSFMYNLFFHYIINIDMLEEFAYLSNVAGGNINLDLLQVSTTQIAKQRTVTRGVNKGAKEDFRSAMERQVSRCEESLDHLLVQFLTQEREVLQLCHSNTDYPL